MTLPFQPEPSEKTLLYGQDGKVLGILHQNIVTAAGEPCYGVLAFNCGNGRVLQIPVPWAVISKDKRTRKSVADVDRMELMEAPHFAAGIITGFDAQFAGEIDAAYGLEFPGIETMNDLA